MIILRWLPHTPGTWLCHEEATGRYLGGDAFIPKEVLCDHIPEWVDHAASFVRRERLRYDVINSPYWDAGLGGLSLAAGAEDAGLTHVGNQFTFPRRLPNPTRLFRLTRCRRHG